MRPKRKKTGSSEGRRHISTRKIMEITEERRLKEEALQLEMTEQRRLQKEAAQKKAAEKEIEHEEAKDIKEEAKEIKPILAIEDSKPSSLPVIQPPQIDKEIKTAHTVRWPVVSVLLLAIFILTLSFKSSGPWAIAVAAILNGLIVRGSSFVLSILPGACTVQGDILNTRYYTVSLHGDLVAFYSSELLVVLTALFVFYQKTNWTKRGWIFILLVMVAAVANILRVVWAFGLALNYSAVSADRYFHSLLVDLVFILIFLGSIFLEFLFFSD